MKIWKEKTAF